MPGGSREVKPGGGCNGLMDVGAVAVWWGNSEDTGFAELSGECQAVIEGYWVAFNLKVWWKDPPFFCSERVNLWQIFSKQYHWTSIEIQSAFGTARFQKKIITKVVDLFSDWFSRVVTTPRHWKQIPVHAAAIRLLNHYKCISGSVHYIPVGHLQINTAFTHT